jgi:hypothetical protein
MSKYRQHYQITPRANKRAEAALDYLLILAIGIGLSLALIKWWSA